MSEFFVEFYLSSSIIISIIIIVISLVFFRRNFVRDILLQKDNILISADIDIDEIPTGTLDRFSDAERWKIQTRVANARTAIDLLNIFSEFQVLQSLELPTISSFSTELHLAKEQAFRDLIRERVVINDKPIEPGSSPSSDPSQFKRDFEARIQEVIAKHVSDPLKRKNISMHICCHLSRTRAGGDSLFAVQDIFTSPQLVITASPHYTHPPVDLLVTEKGWAIISTTSNFDVYLEQDLADNTDDHPEPLVTISALSEEAIPVSETAQQRGNTSNTKYSSKNRLINNISTEPTNWFSRYFPFQKISTYDEQPLPISRKLRLSCSLPANGFTNWDFPREARHKVLEEHKQILIELHSDDGCLGESCISAQDIASCSSTTTSEFNGSSSYPSDRSNYYHPNNSFYNYVTRSKSRNLPRRVDGRARTKRPYPPKHLTTTSLFPPSPSPNTGRAGGAPIPPGSHVASQKYRDHRNIVNAQYQLPTPPSSSNNSSSSNKYDISYNSLKTDSLYSSAKTVSSNIPFTSHNDSNNNSNSQLNLSIRTKGSSKDRNLADHSNVDTAAAVDITIDERSRIRNDSVAQLRELEGAFRKTKASRENLQLQDLSSSGSGNGRIIPTSNSSNNSDNDCGGGKSPGRSPTLEYYSTSSTRSPTLNQQKKNIVVATSTSNKNSGSYYYADDDRRGGPGHAAMDCSPKNRDHNSTSSNNKNDIFTSYNQSRSE